MTQCDTLGIIDARAEVKQMYPLLVYLARNYTYYYSWDDELCREAALYIKQIDTLTQSGGTL